MRQVKVGSYVCHTSKYGMREVTGCVVAEAGSKYGRRYLWVNYTTPQGVTFNTAFWEGVLRLSDIISLVHAPTQEQRISP